MIFGITLSHFAKLQAQGEKVKSNFWINYLLSKKNKDRFKTRRIENLSYSNFVTLENCIEEQNYNDFCAIFVNKYFWQRVYIHNLFHILDNYSKQKTELFEQYPYIFNPPQYGEPAKETIGTELKREFVEEFGNWVILMDVVCKGNFHAYKDIERWKLNEFLFWANYLNGQKIIENVK